MEIRTGRPVTLAPRGMVTSPSPLASAAGADVLRAGGSAVDAAIATAAVLSVVYPHMTGVGGDAFWLTWDAKARKARYLDGGGRAAASASLEQFTSKGLKELPYRGVTPATLTTPGAVASWDAAHRAHGRLPLSRILDAAIGYARDGFPVTARLASWIEATKADLALSSEAAKIFMPGGAVPRAGAMLKNLNLARTLEAIASDGRSGFYEGAVGSELDRFSQKSGGHFRASDLARQDARWGMPLETRYGDVTILNTPPPTQGFAVLEMLNLLEPLELHKKPMMGADWTHLLVQAKQIAYHDRDRWLADPKFSPVPTEMLVSKAYANERRRLIRPRKALAWDEVPSYGSLKGDTTYLATVDGDGNAVSLIQSLYWGFGSAVVAGKTGVVLQNRSAYFSLDPASPNRLEPGKTPLHTLIASLGLKGGKLWSVVGCMGADGQPQIQLQTYLAMIEHGLDIQEALEAPRFLSGRFVLGEPRDTLHIEGRMPAATIAELERRGHSVNRWPDWCELAGHAHGITIDPETGMRAGGADPRSDGAAIGI
ncbi:MAG TPA: gamma-glutamyltransferase [Hyphomicrobiaceae bacterium]|nr:gamma-glutamyltransferase [Hyphomicrobiaceae bacterium]